MPLDDEVVADRGARDADARASDLLPKITRPTGGGAIRGLGEKFSANPLTGSAHFAIPLKPSPGRGGFAPTIDLSYDSSAGNGPFGFGWEISAPSITRRTDKGLPRYIDAEESDEFLLTGADDLVPVSHSSRTVNGVSYTVGLYRPRVENAFERIERWVATTTGASHWRTITRDNVTTLYGVDATSQVADPANPLHVFQYLICRTWDDKGNVTVYDYVADDNTGVDLSQTHEANRTTAIRATQRYLRSIRYGNLQPYLPVWSSDGKETPLPTDFMFEVVLDYGDHSPDAPTPAPDRPWAIRPDPFSSYRAGFEVRTYRRVARILLFNNFPKESTAGADYLVRSYDLTYSDNAIYSFLASVVETGYRRSGASYTKRSMPALDLTYSLPQLQADVITLDPDSLANAPEGLDGAPYYWVDLNGDGLPGILTDSGTEWGYKRNLSPTNLVTQSDGSVIARAKFGPQETVAVLPSRNTLTESRLLDLDGSGHLDVVALDDSAPGFFRRSAHGGWQPFRPFESLAAIDWSDPNVALVDLTGDGLADVLFTEDGKFTYYPSVGDHGFASPSVVPTSWDEERGPAVVLADGTNTIYLADMTGDGLSDLVRVRDGEVCYWPNIGYGRFGAKVTMDHAPRFSDEERFDARRVRLADVDGSGTADLLYIGENGVTVSFNQSGNAWAAPTTVAVFPSADQLSAIDAIDLLGTGTSCLCWSSPLPGAAPSVLRYIDLMGGIKPHLLTSVRNNLGGETRITYAPSTRFFLADEAAGQPWITRLPNPVQVVERVESIDWVGRNRQVTRYAYHHGHFDGYEREFRGFGMVEQRDTEAFRTDTTFPDGETLNWDAASWSPPVLTRTWFHTGVFGEAPAVSRVYASEYWIEPALRPDSRAPDRAANHLSDTVLPAGLTIPEAREACRALAGQILQREVYAEDGSARASSPYSVAESNFTIRLLQPKGTNRHAVFFVHPRETLTLQYERQDDDPRASHEVTLEVDDYGNVLRRVAISYPRRPGYAAPEPTISASAQAALAYDQTRLSIIGTQSIFTNALADPIAYPDANRLPLPADVIEAEVTGVAPASNRAGITNRFTFDEIDGIWSTVWSGAHDIPYEAVPASDVTGSGTPASAPTRRVIRETRTLYRSYDLTTLLPLAQLQSRAVRGEVYRAMTTPGQLSEIGRAHV